uniref:Uncharacterized protein n=1 Tax=Euplotes crassus TaxID=5936 RepID=A0A7S3KLN6_EUPCR|mmetsp:Transcript_31031/g.30580  ORF Transcript_31031/g.30580 Transcript_31031/m.30580 type:complete len:120 (+) Transcript_31031:221-580(+)
MFSDRSKIDRENYRFDKYKGKYPGWDIKKSSQKQQFEDIRKNFRLKQAQNMDPSIKTWRNVNFSSEFLTNQNQNESLKASLSFKKEPTLEAVLNDFSRKRLKLPTIQKKDRSSMGQLIK